MHRAEVSSRRGCEFGGGVEHPGPTGFSLVELCSLPKATRYSRVNDPVLSSGAGPASACGRDPFLEFIGQLDIDIKRRDTFTSIHPNDNLFRIEHDVSRDHGKYLFPQNPK